MKQKQTLLPLESKEPAQLSAFLGASNAPIVHQLQKLANGQSQVKALFVKGAPSTGKSYLLQASCSAAKQASRVAYYFQAIDSAWTVLNVPENALICIDDIDLISSDQNALLKLLQLYETLLPCGGQLIVSSSKSIEEIPLPDLRSRLAIGGVLNIGLLNDKEKQQLLKHEAYTRGIDLDDTVSKYILTHYSRELPDLIRLLNRIDNESLSEQRRVTVPFIKGLLC